MAIDYRNEKIFAFPKGKPHAAVIGKVRTERETRDRKESDKVKARSLGQCEVRVKGNRCKRRAFEVHHHKGGNGQRGRGDSALAKHKTHMCSEHHRKFNAKLLEHVKGNVYREVA